MLLKSLYTESLYGTLNLNVQFKENVTLLVGINGCGKTSVLNVIDWLLCPDLKSLATTDFSILALNFVEKGENYILQACKTKSEFTLSIQSKWISLEPITVKLSQSHVGMDEEYLGNWYEKLSPEKHERPMWELLKSFTKPIVISLDRTISAEVDDVFYVEQQRGDIRKNIRKVSPLLHVQEVTSEKYAEYRAKSIQHDNELKARIVMSALQSPANIFSGKLPRPMKEREIDELERKVTTYLSASIKTDDVAKQVHDFFRSSKTLVPSHSNSHSKEREFLFNLVLSQYYQLDNLAKAFYDFEVKNAEAFKPIKDYLDAVNRFFRDSGKELYFDDVSGRLFFSFINYNEKKQNGRTVNYLSSGEKQILILFTFLAFIAKEDSVFIVDEPELSLHPKWQSEFMESFLQLCPRGTQLLLATHSPDIVGNYRNSCVPLVRHNNAWR